MIHAHWHASLVDFTLLSVSTLPACYRFSSSTVHLIKSTKKHCFVTHLGFFFFCILMQFRCPNSSWTMCSGSLLLIIKRINMLWQITKKHFFGQKRLHHNQFFYRRDVTPESVSFTAERVWLTVDGRGRARAGCHLVNNLQMA